ncbi:oligoendopeptidase F [Kordiimonas sp. SCSIO 12603]|uniref:oligoendopeptidase F n=1 Tax=Kordiimonas sp. SCSIO 12603 TaxID=2829596 RepID=UPI0021080E33|nr:oligoendopeptidase F [Kordiimonas sp. SCSIO 12603]UTW57727.1 oligoendopeptidase F [Kordiimonas sp. SCSIO 12603]
MFKNMRYAIAGLMATTAITALPAQAIETTEPAQIRWDLTDLYKTERDWNKEREQLLIDIEKLARFKGKLTESAKTLADASDELSAINKRTARMFIYASLGGDEDLRNAEGQEKLSLARSVFAKLGQITSYMSPEMQAAGSETLERYIKEDKRLEKHAFNIRDLIKRKEHILGDQAEGVLANAGEVLSGPQRIYSLLTTASIPWPKVTMSDGETVDLNQSMYTKYRAVQNREDRKKVFDEFWSTWKQYEAALGQTLDTLVRSHIFTSKSRKYPTSLDAAVAGSNVPSDVYRALVKAANENLPSMHRYLKLRQRIMGLEDLHYYDIYPEVTQLEREFTLDEAKAMTKASLKPFGEEYLKKLDEGFAGNWMHVYPQPGKRSGAYMQGAGYDEHPYVLLNYNSGFEDVSTFSHEWGHAVHTMLAKENNPYETYSYPIFTAELASTTNEVLLQEHMLAKNLSDAERLYYIDRALESYRGTFFRQTMFAEFELKIHELAEAGEALSGSKMTEVYLDLLKKYHGHDEGVMNIDPLYAIEWAYIPHFYYNFYVYQYATSISGGTMFAERMLSGDEQADDDYLNVLKAGGSKYPHEMLKDAGVDLTSSAPYDALIARMNRLMDEAEVILKRMGK